VKEAPQLQRSIRVDMRLRSGRPATVIVPEGVTSEEVEEMLAAFLVQVVPRARTAPAILIPGRA
jgi:hypothetical protein